MDLEQLKLILNTVGGAADGARDFAIAWLLVEAGKSLISHSLGVASIWGLYKIGTSLISWGREESFAKELRNTLLPQQAYGYVTDDEKTQLRDVVKAASKKGEGLTIKPCQRAKNHE